MIMNFDRFSDSFYVNARVLNNIFFEEAQREKNLN